MSSRRVWTCDGCGKASETQLIRITLERDTGSLGSIYASGDACSQKCAEDLVNKNWPRTNR